MKKKAIFAAAFLLIFGFMANGCTEVETEDVYEKPNKKTKQEQIEETEKIVQDEQETEEADQPDDVALIKQAFSEKYGNPVEEIDIHVNNQTDTHMRGLVKIGPETISGGMFLAAKVNGDWMIVHDGQGVFTCAEVEPFNFPDEMISDCYSGQQ